MVRRGGARSIRRAVEVVGAAALLAFGVAACGAQVTQGHGSAAAASRVLTARQVYLAGARATVQIAGKLSMTEDEYSFGTGVLFDKAKRLVVTNAHVVDGVQGVMVRFNSKQTTTAQIVGRSPCDDLAVLKLGSVPATADQLAFGNSSGVRVTDPVYVLGYPGTLSKITSESAVFTQGAVQSVNVRVDQIDSLPTYTSTIQHSATVNHGNSGGPLLDDHGTVVGINTLSNFGTQSEQVQGQYYSISSNVVTKLLPRLSSGTSIDYAGWNLVPLDDIPLATLFPEAGYGTAAQGKAADAVLASNNIAGLVVTGVDPGSPASRAGVKAGQLVSAIGGTPVSSVSDVCSALNAAGSGPTEVDGHDLITSSNYVAPWRASLSV